MVVPPFARVFYDKTVGHRHETDWLPTGRSVPMSEHQFDVLHSTTTSAFSSDRDSTTSSPTMGPFRSPTAVHSHTCSYVSTRALLARTIVFPCRAILSTWFGETPGWSSWSTCATPWPMPPGTRREVWHWSRTGPKGSARTRTQMLDNHERKEQYRSHGPRHKKHHGKREKRQDQTKRRMEKGKTMVLCLAFRRACHGPGTLRQQRRNHGKCRTFRYAVSIERRVDRGPAVKTKLSCAVVPHTDVSQRGGWHTNTQPLAGFPRWGQTALIHDGASAHHGLVSAPHSAQNLSVSGVCVCVCVST